jgi:hypothetical protein
MALAKRPLQPSMMRDYYTSLTKVFWVSDSYLAHACAWFKLWLIQGKNASAEDAKELVLQFLIIYFLCFLFHFILFFWA